MTSSANVCPQCNAPVGDTDFACRQCGRSFVADPSVATVNPYAPPAFDPSSNFGSNGRQPNAVYARPGEECAEASSALWYAVGGFFCLGFAFGSMAIRTALKAQEKIRARPGLGGGGKASVALCLGVIDVLGWGYWVLKLAGRHHH